MRYFINKIISFSFFSIILFSLVIGVWSSYNGFSLYNLPAPELSDSFSMNEKFRFLKKRKIENVAIGSSMTLINLNSHLMIHFFKSNKFVNAGSWGMSLKDMYVVLNLLDAKKQIKNLVISGNICDFFTIDKTIQKNEAIKYMEGSQNVFTYFNTFHLRYFIKNYPYLNKTLKNNRNYESLCFDEYGGVILASKNFQKDEGRWNDPYIGTPLHKNYVYLKKILSYCKKRKIQFYYFQSPIREGLCHKKNNRILIRHENKLRSIFKNNQNVHFISAGNVKWDDKLFVDGTHLNSIGNKRYTAYCLSQLKYDKN